MNIVLTGFMASGKTEISKTIAAISKYKLIDTDEMIIETAGKTINKIFEEDGEITFRKIETEVIEKAANLEGFVIATGGGVPLREANMKALKKNSIIVNLAPDFSVIKERLETAKKTRPLLQNQSIEEIQKRFNDRKPFYDKCDIKIKIINGRTPKSYALEILNETENYKKNENYQRS